MVCIYILQLEQDKYYIGKTNNPTFRLNDHFNSNGSAWTKKYKPLKLVELLEGCDDYDEDKYTIKYIEKHGIDNVRGGSFCKLELSSESKNTIQRMIIGSTDRCYKCGEKDHYANNCSATHELLEKQEKCSRCNREGHKENDCYAKTNSYGDIISKEKEVNVWCCEYCGKEFDTLKGATFHVNFHCKKKGKVNNKSQRLDDSEKKVNVWCYRCGRVGHYASSCYAEKHVEGYYII